MRGILPIIAIAHVLAAQSSPMLDPIPEPCTRDPEPQTDVQRASKLNKAEKKRQRKAEQRARLAEQKGGV